ncbi:MAG: hypothetical protein Q9160_008045 [Pyrenula sp. 1 TL-2023]
MNHLGIAHDSIQVPYICGGYKACGQDFYEYPQQCGFDITELRRGNLNGKTATEVAAFLQAWLFFGLMECLFAQSDIIIDDDDFLTFEEDQPDATNYLIDTICLPAYIMYFFVDVAIKYDMYDSNSIRSRTDLIQFAHTVINDIILWRAEEPLYDASGLETLDLIILSSMLLCEFLMDALERAFVFECLNKGDSPVVSVRRENHHDDVEDIRLVAESSRSAGGDQIPYVAISHVWSDGLGNPTENSLPRCQLLRLQRLVNNLYHTEVVDDNDHAMNPIYFWIDTLCVPLQEEYRMKAIVLMNQSYENAEKTLVIDSWLENIGLDEDNIVNLLKIRSCTWSQRLWTLPEGSLARENGLFFQAGEVPFQADNLFQTQRTDEPEYISFYTKEMNPSLVQSEPELTRVLDTMIESIPLLNPTSLRFLTQTKEEYSADSSMPQPVLHRLWSMVSLWVHRPFPCMEGVKYYLGMRWIGNRPPEGRGVQTPNDITLMGSSLKNRSTSRPEDEPICLAALLRVELVDILKERQLEKRMAVLARMMDEVGSSVLFMRGVPRLEIEGLRWMPKTFMVRGKNETSEHAISRHQMGKVSESGLLLTRDGIWLEDSLSSSTAAQEDETHNNDAVIAVEGEACETAFFRLSIDELYGYQHLGNFQQQFLAPDSIASIKNETQNTKSQTTTRRKQRFNKNENRSQMKKKSGMDNINTSLLFIRRHSLNPFFKRRSEGILARTRLPAPGTKKRKANSGDTTIAKDEDVLHVTYLGQATLMPCDNNLTSTSSQRQIIIGHYVEKRRWCIG